MAKLSRVAAAFIPLLPWKMLLDFLRATPIFAPRHSELSAMNRPAKLNRSLFNFSEDVDILL